MTRNLKVLGLALIAVFAMSAMAAQAASAHEFTSTSESTDLTAEGTNHVFSANGVEVTCAKATFTGSQTKKVADTVSVTPKYDEPCELGGISVTVTNNSCTYVFGSDTNASGDANIRLNCNDNTKGIVIAGLGCEIYIGDTHTGNVSVNQVLTGVSYTNTGSGKTASVDVNATVSGIAYETNGGFTCSLLGIPTTGTNGTYTGTATVKGYSSSTHTEANQVEIKVD